MKMNEHRVRWANATARTWQKDSPQTLEWWIAFKMGLEKRKDIEQIAEAIRRWDDGGRAGDAFELPAKKEA